MINVFSPTHVNYWSKYLSTFSSKYFAHTWRKINNKSYYLFLLNGSRSDVIDFISGQSAGVHRLWNCESSASKDAIFINLHLICRHQIVSTNGSDTSRWEKGEDGDKTRRIIDCKSVDNSNQFPRFPSIYLRNPKYRTVTAPLCVGTAFQKLYELYFLLTISSTMVLLRRFSDSNRELHRSGTNWNPIL